MLPPPLPPPPLALSSLRRLPAAGPSSNIPAAAMAGPIRIGVLALQGSFREHMTLLNRIPGVEAVEVGAAAQACCVPCLPAGLDVCVRPACLPAAPAAGRAAHCLRMHMLHLTRFVQGMPARLLGGRRQAAAISSPPGLLMNACWPAAPLYAGAHQGGAAVRGWAHHPR